MTPSQRRVMISICMAMHELYLIDRHSAVPKTYIQTIYMKEELKEASKNSKDSAAI